MYLLTSGEWIRDLVPKEAPLLQEHFYRSGTLVAGGKDVVAAVTWDKFVTVWSTKGDMDLEASYSPTRCDNCQKMSRDCNWVRGTKYDDIKVTPHGKIVLLAKYRYSSLLVIMKKAEDGWTIDDSPMEQRCGFKLNDTVYLGCYGDYFDLSNHGSGSNYYYRLSFGSPENNFGGLGWQSSK